MVERELAAADRLFARLAADPSLDDELERRLGGERTPLILALADWAEAPAEGRALLEINAEHAAALAELLEAGRWPGLRDVGADGADAAWMLAQHADRDNDRRRAWLPLVAAAVASGDADPRHLATLTDRIAVVAGEPEAYGTVGGAPDAAEVGVLDGRRAAIGLPSVATDAPYLDDGDLVPFGPDRGDVPVNQWPMVVEGRVSVEAVLEAGVRHVHRIWASRPGDRRLGRLRALAREREVLIEGVSAETVAEVASGGTHGGVVALVGPRRQRTVSELLGEVGEGSFVVMLDGIEDPFNHGQAVRALYASGCDAIVVRRDWETAVGTLTRASGGTSELMPTARAGTALEAADAFRTAGYAVVATDAGDDGTDLHDADLTGARFVLIGGERRGVARQAIERADVRIRIGYGRERAPDLGAAAAAAIIGFEALRQRRRSG